MNNSQTAFKLRSQLLKYLGIFSPHFSKPALAFLGDMLYGIQASKDIKLSCIGRGLDEVISLKKTEERLSRNLGCEGLAQRVSDCLACEGARHIGNDTLIVIDPTDIRKLYARKMPYLAKVRDGSSGEIGNGYHCGVAVACESGGRSIVPLHLRLWSSTAPDFKSENDEIEQIVSTICAGAKRRGIYVVDRGGDRDKLFNVLIDRRLRFIVRLIGHRHLLWRKRPILAEKLVGKCRISHVETIRRETAEGEKIYRIEYGAINVFLPEHPDKPLRMVVVKGFGAKPMMLLTDLASGDSRKGLWQVIEGYLSRWRVEDAIRYIKQSYRLEDIRLMDYTRLRNMMAMLLATVFFASVWLGKSLRKSILVGNITRVSKRLFGVVEFHYYAIADGIAALLRRFGKWHGAWNGPARNTVSHQMELALFDSG